MASRHILALAPAVSEMLRGGVACSTSLSGWGASERQKEGNFMGFLYNFMITSFKIWKKIWRFMLVQEIWRFHCFFFFCGLLLMKIEDSRQSTEKDQ
jgi:hypothetical protein